MGVSRVSEENMKKVESFFVQKVKETGTNYIEATVIEIAEGAEVALATAHKAINELKLSGVIFPIKPKSRRFAITYVYKKDIEDFEAKQSVEGQIEYLKNLVEEQNKVIDSLKKDLNKVKGERNVLAHKLDIRIEDINTTTHTH